MPLKVRFASPVIAFAPVTVQIVSFVDPDNDVPAEIPVKFDPSPYKVSAYKFLHLTEVVPKSWVLSAAGSTLPVTVSPLLLVSRRFVSSCYSSTLPSPFATIESS